MKTLLSIALAAVTLAAQAQFGGGNLVVRIAGDGGTTSGAMPTSLREYKTDGSQVGSDLLLTGLSGSRNVCCSYGENSETAMELSTDGKFLMVTGYDVAPRDAGFDIFLTPRVVGRISVADKSITLSNTYIPLTGDGTRGILSEDGDHFYVCGGDMGLLEGTFSTTPAQVLPLLVSSRHVHRFNGLIYFLGSNAGPNGSNGIATYDGMNQIPILETPNGASGRNFYIVDENTLYLCTSTGGQGLMKMKRDTLTGQWSLAYQLSGIGVVSLAVDGSTLYCTRSDGSAILKTVDTGTSFDAFTTVASAQANTRFRGLVRIPETTASETLAPVNGAVSIGKSSSGGFADTAVADGVSWRVCKFVVTSATSPIVRVRFDYTTTKAAPTAIDWAVTAKMVHSGTFKVQLLLSHDPNNPNNNAGYDVVLPQTAINTTMATYTGSATSTPLSQYVGTAGTMSGRVEIYRSFSAVAAPCVDIDAALLKVTG